MEESRSHWFTEEYTPKRDAAIGAYVHTPASSGAVLREFERALQKAWDEVLPEMETPHDTVPVLRKNIERRLTSLKDALNRDKNKELVSDQPTPATETLGDSSSKTTTARPPYRKVLFLRQPYPDNHVDASFLRDLKRNVNVHPANLPALLRQTLPITQHVASIFIFVVVFIRLSRASLSASALLTLCAVLSGTLRAWAWAIGEPTAWAGVTASLMTAARAPLPSTAQNGNGPCCTGDETAPRLRPVDTTASASTSPVGTLIPLVALYLLSPALKTLTRATTSDSIWALSGTLFAINVLLGDYRAIPTSSSFRRDLVPRLFSHASKKPTLSAPERAPHRAPYFARRAPLPSTLSLTAALSGST
ncbi:hypothetical protein C6P46_000993, partial [Rhodotorula mucilaginosa]